MAGYNPITSSFASINLMTACSTIDQVPLGQGISNSIQVTFGDAQLSDDGNVSLNAAGELTLLHRTRRYQLIVDLRMGRENTNQSADLLAWLEFKLPLGVYIPIPGTTLGVTELASASIREANRIYTTDRNVPIGTKFRVKLARGEAGVDDGGLYTYTPTGSLGILTPACSATLHLVSVDLDG